jgi:type II secretory pathway predicted ATPase ExeA
MRESVFKKRLKADPEAISLYCSKLGWDTERLAKALYATGLSDKATYLETPNGTMIEILAEFLTVTGSNLFLVIADNGMGKSALKEFGLRTLADDSRFVSFSIDNPGPFSVFQIMKLIYTGVTDTKAPGTKELVMAALENALIELRRKGITTLIWVDEGQKLNIDKIALLRSIADIKSPEGLLVCKIMVVGTPDMKDHIETWLKSHPEEAGAFDDRVGLFTLKLNPWKSEHVTEWLNLIHEYVQNNGSSINPFTQDLALTVAEMSEGKPRNVVQLTQMAINLKARDVAKYPQSASLDIPGSLLMAAIKSR